MSGINTQSVINSNTEKNKLPERNARILSSCCMCLTRTPAGIFSKNEIGSCKRCSKLRAVVLISILLVAFLYFKYPKPSIIEKIIDNI